MTGFRVVHANKCSPATFCRSRCHTVVYGRCWRSLNAMFSADYLRLHRRNFARMCIRICLRQRICCALHSLSPCCCTGCVVALLSARKLLTTKLWCCENWRKCKIICLLMRKWLLNIDCAVLMFVVVMF